MSHSAVLWNAAKAYDVNAGKFDLGGERCGSCWPDGAWSYVLTRSVPKLNNPRHRDHVGPPEIRHWFIHKPQEIQYRKTRAAYWLYIRRSRSRAAHFLAQLEDLLDEYPESWPAVCGLESRAMMADFDSDLRAEIRYMKRVVKSQRYLASFTRKQSGDYPLQYVILCHELLAVLHCESGQCNRVEELVSYSKELSRRKRLRFSERRLRCGLLPENRSEYMTGLRTQLYRDWLSQWREINWKWRPARPGGESGE